MLNKRSLLRLCLVGLLLSNFKYSKPMATIACQGATIISTAAILVYGIYENIVNYYKGLREIEDYGRPPRLLAQITGHITVPTITEKIDSCQSSSGSKLISQDLKLIINNINKSNSLPDSTKEILNNLAKQDNLSNDTYVVKPSVQVIDSNGKASSVDLFARYSTRSRINYIDNPLSDNSNNYLDNLIKAQSNNNALSNNNAKSATNPFIGYNPIIRTGEVADCVQSRAQYLANKNKMSISSSNPVTASAMALYVLVSYPGEYARDKQVVYNAFDKLLHDNPLLRQMYYQALSDAYVYAVRAISTDVPAGSNDVVSRRCPIESSLILNSFKKLGGYKGELLDKYIKEVINPIFFDKKGNRKSNGTQGWERKRLLVATAQLAKDLSCNKYHFKELLTEASKINPVFKTLLKDADKHYESGNGWFSGVTGWFGKAWDAYASDSIKNYCVISQETVLSNIDNKRIVKITELGNKLLSANYYVDDSSRSILGINVEENLAELKDIHQNSLKKHNDVTAFNLSGKYLQLYEKQLEYQGKLHDAVENLKATNGCANSDIKTNESSVIVNNGESKIISDEDIAKKYHGETSSVINESKKDDKEEELSVEEIEKELDELEKVIEEQLDSIQPNTKRGSGGGGKKPDKQAKANTMLAIIQEAKRKIERYKKEINNLNNNQSMPSSQKNRALNSCKDKIKNIYDSNLRKVEKLNDELKKIKPSFSRNMKEPIRKALRQSPQTAHGRKHYISKPSDTVMRAEWKRMIESTRHGDAKYKPGVDREMIQKIAWREGTPTNNGRPWKVMKFDDIIGANSGKETKYIRVEKSANTIHGHPISLQDFIKWTK